MEFKGSMAEDKPRQEEPAKQAPSGDDIRRSVMTEVDSKLSSLESRVERILSEKLDPVLYASLAQQTMVHKDSVNEPEDDETWFEAFKANPKDTIQRMVAPIVTSSKDEVKKELHTDFTRKADMEKYDNMAVQKYPQLLNKDHALYKEFQEVMSEKKKRDPEWNMRPEAVVDSAQIAFARLVEKGVIMPEGFVEEAKRLVSIHDSSMLPLNSSHTSNPNANLTKSQSVWSSKLGVSNEKYKNHLRQ